MTECVVLLNDAGNPIGSAQKATVHTADTPLHLGFSAYVKNPRGQLLITRRAVAKKTFPGVWTNSFCGHPAPGESLIEAVRRRADQELGLSLGEIRCVLPDFLYRAVDSRGILENEMCPVLVALSESAPSPTPEEVEEFVWADPNDIFEAVLRTPFVFSPWMVEQLRHSELRSQLICSADLPEK